LWYLRDHSFIEENPAIQLAARNARQDELAQHRLERSQLLGDAELQIEEARVYRAQLEAQRAAGESADAAA